MQVFFGATGRTRTDGLRITNALLYQLSHSSKYYSLLNGAVRSTEPQQRV